MDDVNKLLARQGGGNTPDPERLYQSRATISDIERLRTSIARLERAVSDDAILTQITELAALDAEQLATRLRSLQRRIEHG